jgi:hypothetical protein
VILSAATVIVASEIVATVFSPLFVRELHWWLAIVAIALLYFMMLLALWACVPGVVMGTVVYDFGFIKRSRVSARDVATKRVKRAWLVDKDRWSFVGVLGLEIRHNGLDRVAMVKIQPGFFGGYDSEMWVPLANLRYE